MNGLCYCDCHKNKTISHAFHTWSQSRLSVGQLWSFTGNNYSCERASWSTTIHNLMCLSKCQIECNLLQSLWAQPLKFLTLKKCSVPIILMHWKEMSLTIQKNSRDWLCADLQGSTCVNLWRCSYPKSTLNSDQRSPICYFRSCFG